MNTYLNGDESLASGAAVGHTLTETVSVCTRYWVTNCGNVRYQHLYGPHYCCGKGTKPFFFLIPLSMQRRLTKQKTHSHFPHISSGGHWKGQSHVTDRQMLWYSAKIIRNNYNSTSPIPFVLHKWTYYYTTTCTPWCWKAQSSLGDLKLLQSASSGQNLHSVPLNVTNALDMFLPYHIIWS